MSFNPEQYTAPTEAELAADKVKHLMAEGPHILIITSVEAKQTRKGSNALVLGFEVLSNVKGDSGESSFEKGSKFNWFCDTDNSFARANLHALWTIGGKPKWDMTDSALMVGCLLGKRCYGVAKHEEYNGRTNAKIDGLKVLTLAQDEKYPCPPKWETGGGSLGEDDIPF